MTQEEHDKLFETFMNLAFAIGYMRNEPEMMARTDTWDDNLTASQQILNRLRSLI